MKRTPKTRSAFTLVELLTVIIIISILAGLGVGVIPGVIQSVDESAIRAEIQQLATAVEAYKAEYGEYPPDGTNIDEVKKHIYRCYPEATSFDIDNNGNSIFKVVSPRTALYLFLGPHNSDPKKPFYYYGLYYSNDTPTEGFFQFEKSRIKGVQDFVYSMAPKGYNEPYTYLRSHGISGKKYYRTTAPNDSATVFMACMDSNQNYYNENTFQIASAGIDDDWGFDGMTGNLGGALVQCMEDGYKVYRNNGTSLDFLGNAEAGNTGTKAIGNNIINAGRKCVRDLEDTEEE